MPRPDHYRFELHFKGRQGWRFVAFDLGGGKRILVETPVTDRNEAELVSRGEVVQKASASFHEALAGIRPVVAAIFETVSGIAKAPDETKVELSIALRADAGVVLAKVGTEGAIKLSLTWKAG